MLEFETTRNERLAPKIIKGLASRNMEGHYAATKEEALELALSLIPEGAKVGWGGSFSIEQIGLKEAVRSGNYQVIDRDRAEGPEAVRAAELACFDTDFFLCTAALCFGPRHILMVVGMNKVCKDLDAAVYRARNVAAPINAQRFPIKTPCKVNGSCADCKSPQSICAQFLVTRRSMDPGRFQIILVNDDLGF